MRFKYVRVFSIKYMSVESPESIGKDPRIIEAVRAADAAEGSMKRFLVSAITAEVATLVNPVAGVVIFLEAARQTLLTLKHMDELAKTRDKFQSK